MRAAIVRVRYSRIRPVLMGGVCGVAALLGCAIWTAAPAGADQDPDQPAAVRARPLRGGAAPSSSRPITTAYPERLSLTFSNVNVRDALVRIAQYSGADVLLAPGATGNISINLRQRTAEEAIRMVAASAGLYVTQAKGAYVIGTAEEVQRAISEFGLTEVVPLQYAKPDDAVKYLGQTAPTVKVEPTANGVAMTGLLEDLRRAREAIRGYDIPPVEAPDPVITSLVAIEKASPEKAEAVLKQAFPGAAISRQDQVLVASGPSSVVGAFERAAKAIDVAPPTLPDQPKVAVYRTQYINAERAEKALKEVFPSVKIAASPEPNVPPTAVFLPLTSGAFSSAGAGGTGSGGTGGGMGGGMGGGGMGGSMGQGAGGGQGAVAPSFTRSSSLILVGPASEVDAAGKALTQMDVPQASVRIDAALVEVSNDGLDELGVKWSWKDGNFAFAQTKGGSGTVTTSAVNTSDFTATIDALITRKKARMLANPNISCVDNEDASIFIGELRRFRGSTVVTPGIGTVQATETVPVGIALLVRPRIHPDGAITLKVHPVVSSVLTVVDGLPQTASREADTTVRIREGEELIIGGLTRVEDTHSVEKIPLLGDLPLIGALFRSTSTTKARSEIIVLIRVYPVYPDPAPSQNFRKGLAP